jgi:hypothetical protein
MLVISPFVRRCVNGCPTYETKMFLLNLSEQGKEEYDKQRAIMVEYGAQGYSLVTTVHIKEWFVLHTLQRVKCNGERI